MMPGTTVKADKFESQSFSLSFIGRGFTGEGRQVHWLGLSKVGVRTSRVISVLTPYWKDTGAHVSLSLFLLLREEHQVSWRLIPETVNIDLDFIWKASFVVEY